MKRLILIAVLFLCSCALFKGPAPFDNNEYALINRIYTLSEVYKIDCGNVEKTKANFSNLAEISMELVNYSSDIPNNLDTVNLVIPLHKMISGADVKFRTETHGIVYCKLKLDNIETSAGIVKAVVAKRKRI
jgi:hypothetical protein